MNLFLESLRSALAAIRAHRLRSFLTSLGIIIGVASVITVISLIQGLSKSVSDQFEGVSRSAPSFRPDRKPFWSGEKESSWCMPTPCGQAVTRASPKACQRLHQMEAAGQKMKIPAGEA